MWNNPALEGFSGGWTGLEWKGMAWNGCTDSLPSGFYCAVWKLERKEIWTKFFKVCASLFFRMKIDYFQIENSMVLVIVTVIEYECVFSVCYYLTLLILFVCWCGYVFAWLHACLCLFLHFCACVFVCARALVCVQFLRAVFTVWDLEPPPMKTDKCDITQSKDH